MIKRVILIISALLLISSCSSAYIAPVVDLPEIHPKLLITKEVSLQNQVLTQQQAEQPINTDFPSKTNQENINYFNYPIIIIEKGINTTQAKQLVYSVPEEYYKYVKTIEFTTKPAHVTTLDEYEQKKIWTGWNNVYWNYKHECYNGKIMLTQLDGNRLSRDLLIHELGHIYEYCILKKNVSTEEFADNFEIR